MRLCSTLGLAAFTFSLLLAAQARAAPTTAASGEPSPFYDPRSRPPPRPHRFKLGFELDYVRLSRAMNPDTGATQRFHWVPIQIDFAYQAHFLKFVMVRPSVAIGPNAGNTFEAMPFTIHPQIHAGYQRSLIGVALGWGMMIIPIQLQDVVSTIRGGQGRPTISNNQHIHLEVSLTTRPHRRRRNAPGAGELMIALHLGGMGSTLRHFDLDDRSWRFLLGFNIGWFFGDGRKARQQAAPPPPPPEP